MKLFDPHIHMTSRTTDDYQAMAAAGIAVVVEPAFWVGQPRTHVGTFEDYFLSLLGWERFRASMFGIRHYATIAMNPRERSTTCSNCARAAFCAASASRARSRSSTRRCRSLTLRK